MDAYDRDLREKLTKLESIEARLAQHERKNRLYLILLLVIASAVLAHMGYHIISL